MTDRVVVPSTLLVGSVAVIVVEPTATLVARPGEPAPLPIAAVAGVDDAHVTAAVRSCVLLSLNVPVAVNCCW